MSTQKMLADQAFRKAETETQRAGTEEQFIKNAAARLGLSRQGYSLVRDDINGDISLGDGHKYRAVSITEGLNRAFNPPPRVVPPGGQAEGAPPGAPVPWGVGAAGSAIAPFAFMNFGQAQTNNPGMIVESNETRNRVNNDYYTATAVRNDINNGAMVLASNKNTPLQSGALTPYMQNIITKYNMIT
jgi:hypothetical protein